MQRMKVMHDPMQMCAKECSIECDCCIYCDCVGLPIVVRYEGFVGCLLNVPATRKCISGTDLLRQLYVLPY